MKFLSVLQPNEERPGSVLQRDAEPQELGMQQVRKLSPLENLETAVRNIELRIPHSSPLLSPSHEAHLASEQYRIVRTRIIHSPGEATMIMISSPGIGEGKTVTAINLAGVLALKSEEKVLLLDADLRRPTAHAYLNVFRTPGLAEVLAGECPLNAALLQVEKQPNFYILPAGSPTTNPAELFDSSGWSELAQRLRREFRRVVLDCPPVAAVADYDLIAAECDKMILVVRPDHTHRKTLANALPKVTDKLVGVVLNDAREWLLWKHPAPYEYARTTKELK